MLGGLSGLDEHYLRKKRPHNLDLAIGSIRKLPFEEHDAVEARNHSGRRGHAVVAEHIRERNGRRQQFARRRFGAPTTPIIAEMLKLNELLYAWFPRAGVFDTRARRGAIGVGKPMHPGFF